MKGLLLIATIFIGVSGFCQNPKIIFREDFENPSLVNVFARWDDSKNSEGMSFSDDVPDGSKGKHSLMMTYTPGKNHGGHLYKLLHEGYDSLFARYYVKFIPKHEKVSHLVQMGGYNPLSKWPKGGAGIKPFGDESFISGVEPKGHKWHWDFYTYWMDMHGNPRNLFYGNSFNPGSTKEIEQGKWICVEFMIKLNSMTDASNGEQAFWIDGKKVLHLKKGYPKGYWEWGNFYHHPDSTEFEGFRWRNTEDLKINLFWLNYYVSSGKEGEVYKVLFDDVIISTKYIGTM